jgi:hypothetical protein
MLCYAMLCYAYLAYDAATFIVVMLNRFFFFITINAISIVFLPSLLYLLSYSLSKLLMLNYSYLIFIFALKAGNGHQIGLWTLVRALGLWTGKGGHMVSEGEIVPTRRDRPLHAYLFVYIY